MRTRLKQISKVFRVFSAAVVFGIVAVARGEPVKSFPDDWFFEGAQRPAPLKALEGKAAAPISAAAWIGSEVSLKDQRGKVVVLDFWATWCGPCMASIPENVALVKKYKGEDLVFVGIHDASSGWEKAPAVVKDKNINYSVAHDKSGGIGASAGEYKVQFWPTYVVIDRAGLIRARAIWISCNIKQR